MSYFFSNIPNIVTIIRIILTPIFFLLFIYQLYSLALLCFLIASLTDILDGYLARKYNLTSNFGIIYDPLADKILILSAFLCMLINPPFILRNNPGEAWLSVLLYFPLLIIVSRDFLITVLRNRLRKKNIILKANYLAKTKTAFQIIFINIYLLEFVLMNLNLNQTNFNFGIVKIDIAIPIISGFVFLLFEFFTVFFSIISALVYFLKNRKFLF